MTSLPTLRYVIRGRRKYWYYARCQYVQHTTNDHGSYILMRGFGCAFTGVDIARGIPWDLREGCGMKEGGCFFGVAGDSDRLRGWGIDEKESRRGGVKKAPGELLVLGKDTEFGFTGVENTGEALLKVLFGTGMRDRERLGEMPVLLSASTVSRLSSDTKEHDGS